MRHAVDLGRLGYWGDSQDLDCWPINKCILGARQWNPREFVSVGRSRSLWDCGYGKGPLMECPPVAVVEG